MGYQVPRKTARLQFEGDEYDGCEITCKLDLTFAASEHMDALQRSDDTLKFREMLGFFAENCIASWNLEDGAGQALTVSAESFLQFPGWFGLRVINGWKQAVEEASAVPGPLAEPSINGSTSPEQSAMTEVPSSALESLPTPSS